MNIHLENTGKIYAVLIVKHPDATGEIYLVKAPESITEKVQNLSAKFPESKIRVFEKGYQSEYFSDKNCIW